MFYFVDPMYAIHPIAPPAIEQVMTPPPAPVLPKGWQWGKPAKALPTPQLSPETQSVVARPDLSGFHLSFSKQPVLTEQGAPPSLLVKNRAIAYEGTLAQVIQQILPYGWHVYIKDQLGPQMGFPVMINSNGKPWTANLKAALKQAGVHGAIWWGPHILTLWPAPVMPSYQPAPDLKGFAPVHLSVPVAHVRTIQKTSFHSSHPAVTQTIPLQGATPLQGAKSVFILNQNNLILTDLQKWAKQSGWTVVWQVPEDWQVPNTTTFNGDFQNAVSQVVQALSANGANVHAVFHTANNTVVISGAGGGE